MSEQVIIPPSTVPFSGLVQFDHNGETVRWFNDTGVEVPAGTPVIQGNLFGVPVRPIVPGAWGSLNIEGAMVAPRRPNDPGLVAGADAFWDDANLWATSLAAGNTYMGKVECGPGANGTPGSVAVADSWVYIQVEAAANRSTDGFAAVTAAGTVASNAANLTPGAINVVTGALGAGVKLPTLPAPAYSTGANVRLEVKNNLGGTNTLPVYPDSNSVINGLTNGAAIVFAAEASCVFRCGGPNQWFTVPTVPA